MRDERVIAEIMPLLNKKWVSIADNSSTLFPLFETFESLVQSLGVHIGPYAQPIFTRACKILSDYVIAIKVDEENIYSKSNFMVRSVDLLGALFNSLGMHSQALIVQSDLFQSLIMLVRVKDNTVKQYAFGLLGDMAKCAGPFMIPHLPVFLKAASEHLQYNDQMPTTLTVCNNACWFIGQVAVQREIAVGLQDFYNEITDKIASMFMAEKVRS